MINELYSQKLLHLAANIPYLGRLDKPDASAKVHARLCGSTLSVDLKIENGIITDFAQEVQACALGQASASLMGTKIIGMSVTEAISLRDAMHNMLKNNGPPPSPPFEDFAIFEPIRAYKPRHASTLLIFDAVVKALENAKVISPDLISDKP